MLEDDTRVLGFAHVAPSSDDDADERVGELTGIYVVPERWGSGGGRLLMERAVASLRSAGFSEATLWVLDTNERARRFYEMLEWAPDRAAKVDQREGVAMHQLRYRLALP